MARSSWTMTRMGAVFVGAAFLSSCSSGPTGAAHAGQSPSSLGGKTIKEYKPGETVTFRINGPVCYETGYHRTFAFEIESEQGSLCQLDMPPSPYVSYEPPASFVEYRDQIETWDQKSWKRVEKEGSPKDGPSNYEGVQVPAGTYYIHVLVPSKEWAAKVPNPGDKIAVDSVVDAGCERRIIGKIVIK
jgi:hypothetical protein